MKISLAQVIIPMAIVGAMPQEAAGAEPTDSVNLGFGGLIRTMPHCDASVHLIEYEHLLSPTIAVLGRGNGVDYKFDDGNYREDGTLRGLDIGIRYYPAGNMHGFFTGGSLGYWNGDWTFIHDMGRPSQYLGTAHSNSMRLNFDIGNRTRIRGTNISIMLPDINFGKFFSTSSCDYTAPASMVGTPCNQKSEVNAYLFIGIGLGVAF